MKFVKIYLVIITILLFVGIGLSVYVWYMLQEINTATNGTSMQNEQPSSIENTETLPPSEGLPAEPIIIKTEDLPETQQKIVKELGLEGDSFTITPEMVKCAESAIGADRVDAIVNGSAPSTIESLKLLPCLKK